MIILAIETTKKLLKDFFGTLPNNTFLWYPPKQNTCQIEMKRVGNK